MINKIKKVKSNIKDLFKRFIKVLRKPEMIILPGSLAFYFFLAIIPSLSILSYVASVLNLSVDYIYNFIASLFSSDVADLILGVSLESQTGIEFIVTIFIGLYVASNGADAIITTSNTIYGIKNTSWFRRRIKAIFMTFLIVLLLLFMLIVPVFGNTIITLIQDVNFDSDITNKIVTIFSLMEGPLSWLIMYLIIHVLYKVAPDRNNKVNGVKYGALFTTVAFILGTKLYSLYIANYGSYQNLYGGLASIVVLMIWLYYLSYIFTVGMALNIQKDEDDLTKTGIINE